MKFEIMKSSPGLFPSGPSEVFVDLVQNSSKSHVAIRCFGGAQLLRRETGGTLKRVLDCEFMCLDVDVFVHVY